MAELMTDQTAAILQQFVLTTHRLNRSTCRLGCGLGWAQDGIQIPTVKGQFSWWKMAGPGHARRSIYSKWLTRGRNRCGAHADCRVLWLVAWSSGI